LKTREVCIIGNGISAYYFLFSLINKNINFNIDITWIYSSNTFTRVDDKIWPIISLNGISKGFNALGDNLYDSFHCFSKYQGKYSYATSLKQYCFFKEENSESKDKFLRRHNSISGFEFGNDNYNGAVLESYFVKPWFFFNEIDLLLQKQKNIKIKKLNQLVVDVNEGPAGHNVVFHNNSVLKTRNLFIFSGTGSKFLPINFYLGSKTQRNKNSYGKIYEIQNINLKTEPFILSDEKQNIIYDGKSTIQTNISPIEKDSYLADLFHAQFGLLFGKDYDVYLGARDKGPKRLPQIYIDNYDGRFIFKLSGLYKNAWTIALKEVIKVVDIWIDKKV
jgi:hypothetical protein